MAIRLRELTEEERATVEKMAASRTAPARQVERAQILWQAGQGRTVAQIAQHLRLNPQTVRDWLKRFNAEGLAGLDDRPRPGKPPTYTPEQTGQVIACALSDPQELGLPFASWTLDRLAAYLSESESLPIKRSRISELLVAEGLRWRQQETWFGERVDPEFAEKRGASRRSTPPRLRAAS
jgi:transposase